MVTDKLDVVSITLEPYFDQNTPNSDPEGTLKLVVKHNINNKNIYREIMFDLNLVTDQISAGHYSRVYYKNGKNARKHKFSYASTLKISFMMECYANLWIVNNKEKFKAKKIKILKDIIKIKTKEYSEAKRFFSTISQGLNSPITSVIAKSYAKTYISAIYTHHDDIFKIKNTIEKLKSMPL